MPVTEFTSSALDRRSFLMMAVAAAGAPLLAGCGSGAAGSSGGKKTTFLSYLPLETLSLAPELLAVAGGHFAKHGLDVKLQPVKGSPQAMQTLLAGISPITRVGQIDVMTAVADTGQPLVNIGTLSRGSSLRFVYSKKRHPLAKPQDFVGQTMGVPSEGGTSDKVVSLVLASAGIDPKQTKRQVVGLTPGTFNLVEQGRIVGYVVSVDTANLLTSKNSDVGLFDPGKYVKSDQQVYVTTKDAATKDAQTLTSFMAGIHDAVAAMVADQSLDETVKKLRDEYSFASLNDDKVAKASLTMLRNSWTGGDPSKPLLVTDKAVWTAGYKELTSAGVAKPGGDAPSWFDNGLLPKT
ncbi:ABC transporter substrate-binding protein [Actinomadura madurae]|uniref:NitT/TauT family transport system substrate-binding protein n=1 Tax=Actinomadura madurae TaxID=1993 RepID=A0A1I4Y3L3_9ACTN|nr:ABC transporter substrate-binding protein [Actinomadura madurae]SFN32664.1 NitT/TauT family transport system substrate-binding protein [Actinomadura madurae]SPT63787.1 ABC-type taurine transport system, periplasmic component [Actinomadura madurae]